MMLVCEKCDAKFAVPDSAIPAEGRKVKCSKCAHVWHQKPLEEVADLSEVTPPPKEAEPIPEGSNVPAERKRLPVPMGMKVAAGVLFLLIVVVKILASPGTASWLGLANTEHVAFQNITADVKRVGNKLRVYVKGELKNEAYDITYTMKDVHVTLLTDGGSTLNSLTYEMEEELTMEPQEAYTFEPQIDNISGNAKTMVLDIGNGLERAFRD